MKRILFVNGHLNVGGVEKTLVTLLNHIDLTKYEVDLLLLEDGGDFIMDLPSSVNVHVFPINRAYGPILNTLFVNIVSLNFKMLYVRLVLLLSKILGKKCLSLLRIVLPIKSSYDYLIAYRKGICADIVSYALPFGKKLLWWHHGKCPNTKSEIESLLNDWSKFDIIISVSEGCKKELDKVFPSIAKKIKVMHNMIDINEIKSKANHNHQPIKDDCVSIISVGNLLVDKHFENTIYVTERLIKEGITNFHWKIVGGGELYDYLNKMIIDKNLANYIELVGSKNNPYALMKAANIFVHPSYIEALSTTILEAMALEIPCVVTKTDIPQDFTRNGINCIEVEQNEYSLFLGTKELIDNLSKASYIVNNASIMIRKEFAPEVIIQKFYSLLN